MFWGLIMEPNKRYTQTVEKGFHLSMASLDASTADQSIVQVMICYDKRTYLLCTLQKGSIWQVPLDLVFQEGTKIAFTCNGGGHVHLTGYIIPDENMSEFGDLEYEGEDEEVPTLVNSKKRKTVSSQNDSKNSKPQKKVKLDESVEDDDESDSDIAEKLSLEGEVDDSDDEDDEDDNEEEDDESDDDEDEDDEEEEESVEEPSPVKLSKKQLKKLKQNQQQNQNQKNQENKKDKQKMVNGTDKPAEQKQDKKKKNKENKGEDKSEKQQQQKKRTVEGGVQVEDIKEGNGPAAKPGKFVSVYYVGTLKNGKKFDSTTQGAGFRFKLGKGEVIKGWDVGISGMKVGGKRRLTIPPNMAYGAKGSPPVIPPHSLLNFDVELKAVH